MAVPEGLLRAGLVHRIDPAGAPASPRHRAAAYPDRRGDRGSRPLGGRSRHRPPGVVADPAPRLRRPRPGAADRAAPRPARTTRGSLQCDCGRLADRAQPRIRARIEFVAIDPAAAYAAAIRAPGLLANATLVVDHFHLIKLANDAVTKGSSDQGTSPRRLGPQGPPRPKARSGVGQPAPTPSCPGTLVEEGFRQDVERHHR